MKLSGIQILIVRVVLGALFLSLGVGKIQEGWLNSREPLIKSLNSFHEHASGPQLIYLEYVAIPYAGMWSKILALGETSLGISLLLGLLTRLSSLAGMGMVLNLHAATGNLFSLDFFGTPWAALLIACLLVVFLARAGRWMGIDALLVKSGPGEILW